MTLIYCLCLNYLPLSLQVSNEVKAARSLPDCSSLGHHVAWKDGADGSMLSVSLYAGCSVETLLQLPAAKGGWADLDLQQRVEVARDVLAGGVLALIKMRPWVSWQSDRDLGQQLLG